MKLYFETSIVLAISNDDTPDEVGALTAILDWFTAGRITVVTSEVSRLELDPFKDKHGNTGSLVCRLIAMVPFVEDQTLVGFNNHWGRHGGASCPIIEDDPIAAALWRIGIARKDAHHLMIAIRDKCDVFLTCDKGILRERNRIQGSHCIQPMTPSDFKIAVDTGQISI